MIIIGNEHIPYNSFKKIKAIIDINNTKPNSIVVFDYEIELLKYCNINNIQSAVLVSNVKEAIFCNSLNSSYIIVENNISKNIQNIAVNYMFDSKILEIITNDDEIEQIAKNEIDGCIYKELIWIQ